MRRPYVIMVLDGFGLREESSGNAIQAANTPVFDRLFARYPLTRIGASGTDVGITEGLMGNSEVGHMNIGAGRVIEQDIVRIDRTIREGTFFENPAFLKAVERAKSQGTRLHLFGLVSDGGVHSADRHYFALVELAARHGLRGDRLVFHVFTDGRDTGPRSAAGYLARLEDELARTGAGVIGSVIGRFYAMDRDKRWERTEIAYRALVEGRGEACASAEGALEAAYAAGETDEFVKPRIVAGAPRIARGDAVISFDFRADRVRQITEALAVPGFAAFPVKELGLLYVTMTEYKSGYPVEIAFRKPNLEAVFGAVLERAGLTQLRIAETEKYAHVTFFFNGGRETPFVGEDRIIVPSPKVATYDEKPEMSALEVTDRVVDAIESDRYAAIVMNFANADMIGHTGDFQAAIRAVETLDACVGRVAAAVTAKGGGILLTADHGNIEDMLDEHGGPKTAHTTNPVPVLLIDDHEVGRELKPDGRLADIVPTVLELMGLDQPPEMTGRSLLGERRPRESEPRSPVTSDRRGGA